MKVFVKRLNNNKGYTMIELLASLTLFSLVAGIIYGTINFGFDSYHRVNIESSLRDEGDLIMSSVISELYRYAPDSVERIPTGIRLVKKDNPVIEEISVINGVLNIGEVNKLKAVVIKSTLGAGTNIDISDCGGQNQCVSGTIQINLVLEQHFKANDTPRSLRLESKFGF